METKIIPGVPEQRHGGSHNTESRRCFDDENTAAREFLKLKARFLEIDKWQELAGKSSAEFLLFDKDGSPVQRNPLAGDFVRIDIPGPGNFEADGFDWVKITKISHQFLNEGEQENLLLECHPSPDPTRPDNRNIAHFYNAESSSTFMISRAGTCLKAAVYGRNELPNFQHSELADKIRNGFIAMGGILGLSKIEWQALTDGLVGRNDD